MLIEKYKECQKCGATEDLEIHHIGDYSNQEILLLCKNCHRKEHLLKALKKLIGEK